uniref:Uncharacterized protein n=1 Tax=Eutreptiella gymnastica TaxID=73025 RepID=A0A7S4FIC5_9EUGL|mmetsp:Transcript_17722/g.30692  ORF Transcript_17722/g.30692 Transcript_17722/m.30692 type:complete len:175 (+) Transcript_17722:683-1207(+)
MPKMTLSCPEIERTKPQPAIWADSKRIERKAHWGRCFKAPNPPHQNRSKTSRRQAQTHGTSMLDKGETGALRFGLYILACRIGQDVLRKDPRPLLQADSAKRPDGSGEKYFATSRPQPLLTAAEDILCTATDGVDGIETLGKKNGDGAGLRAQRAVQRGSKGSERDGTLSPGNA